MEACRQAFVTPIVLLLVICAYWKLIFFSIVCLWRLILPTPFTLVLPFGFLLIVVFTFGLALLGGKDLCYLHCLLLLFLEVESLLQLFLRAFILAFLVMICSCSSESFPDSLSSSSKSVSYLFSAMVMSCSALKVALPSSACVPCP